MKSKEKNEKKVRLQNPSGFRKGIQKPGVPLLKEMDFKQAKARSFMNNYLARVIFERFHIPKKKKISATPN